MDVASFGEESHVRWLKTFILLVLSLLFVIGFATLREPIPAIAAIAMAAFMSTITYIGLARPQLFNAVPKSLRLPSRDIEEEKYAASQLEESQKEEFLERLTSYFEQEQPFLQQDLTLRQVGEQVRIPYRYVSQVINEKLDSHFVDFVNSYRIEAAKTLLADPDSAHLSIDGIASDAGFKSRSTFYAAFKKATGQTPGAYRKKPGPDRSPAAK
jgi:YesN/AraC family two-component response regulator